MRLCFVRLKVTCVGLFCLLFFSSCLRALACVLKTTPVNMSTQKSSTFLTQTPSTWRRINGYEEKVDTTNWFRQDVFLWWRWSTPRVYARRAVTVNDDRLQDDDTLCMFVQRITRSFHYLNQSNTTSWLFCVLGTAFMARFQGTTSLGVRWGRGVNLHKVIYIHVLEHKHRQAANSQGVHKLRLSYVLAAI